MKTTANKSDIVRLSRAFGFQHAALLEFQRLGLIDRDLSLVPETDPFLTKMSRIWGNRLLMKAQLDGVRSTERKELVGYEVVEEVQQWELDAADIFLELYRSGREAKIEVVLVDELHLYPDAITREVRCRANQIRRAAAEKVRRERKNQE